MRMAQAVSVGLIGMVALTGCRTATRVVDVPRVDMEVAGTGGNRGYLVGTPPPPAERKTTRQIIQTDIEIPAFYKPQPGGAYDPNAGGWAQEGAGAVDAGAPAASLGLFDTYVVQKGESLWTIAAKPEIYGKASAWKRLYDANRDILKSPDQVREGMTLKVPRGEGGEGVAYDDEGTTFKK